MRKRGFWIKGIAAGTALSLSLITAGCGKKEKKDQTAENTAAMTEISSETATETATEKATEENPTEESTEKSGETGTEEGITPGDGRETGFTSDDQILNYLEGAWEFCPYGFDAPEGEEVDLSFTQAQGSCSFLKRSDASFVSGGIILGKTSDELAASDMFTLTITDITRDFCDAPEELKGVSTDFQFMMGLMEGRDVLILRQLGNGDSALVHKTFLDDTACWDGCWLFVRSRDLAFSDQQMDEWRKKDQDFYAFMWMDSGDKICLQAVSGKERDIDWYGETVPAVLWSLSETEERPYQIVTYWLKDGEQFAHPGSFQPGLVHVKTDAEGCLTELTRMEYLGFGAYRQGFSRQEEDPDYRSPAVYESHDTLFLGDWRYAGQFDGSMSIEAASPQVGGYHLEITLSFEDGSRADISADAHIEGGLLVIHSGSVKGEDGKEAYGVAGSVKITDVGAEVVFTESPDSRIRPDEVFTFFR